MSDIVGRFWFLFLDIVFQRKTDENQIVIGGIFQCGYSKGFASHFEWLKTKRRLSRYAHDFGRFLDGERTTCTSRAYLLRDRSAPPPETSGCLGLPV